jgi:hypothetical protein
LMGTKQQRGDFCGSIRLAKLECGGERAVRFRWAQVKQGA